MNQTNKKDRITIYEVANASNVSLATVSRVINNRPNVTEKTRKNVLETIARLGYRPSALAQGLAKNKSTNVGIVVPDTNSSHTSTMLTGMVDIAKIYGYITSLFIAKPFEEDTLKMTEKLISSHVDGAVIFDDNITGDTLDLLQNYNIPLVIVGREMEGNKICSIVMDYKAPLIQALSAHMYTGGKKITFVSYENETSMMANLKETTRLFCEQNELEFRECTITGQIQTDIDTARNYIEQHKDSEYFVTPSVSTGAIFTNVSLDLGLKVPEDIQVLAIHDSKYSQIFRPQISAIYTDMFEAGSIAMRMLTKLLDDTLEKKVYYNKCTYKIRGTTKK